MAQITRVTSEALQATLRRLLPSQQGFGEDLEASNVIIPTIDLTPTAEGSQLREDLQSATDKGMTSVVGVAGATTSITSTAGFYRLVLTAVNADATATRGFNLVITDGFSATNVYIANVNKSETFNEIITYPFFVAVGNELQVVCNPSLTCYVLFKQLASVDGILSDPLGFQSQ